MVKLGDKLKELRVNLGMRQDELAEGICTRSYISLIENNQMTPSNEVLTKLSKKLGYDLHNIKDTFHPSSPYQKKINQIETLLYNQDFKEAEQIFNEIPQDADLPPDERAKWLWEKGSLIAYEQGLWQDGLKWCQEALRLLNHSTDYVLHAKIYHLQGAFYYHLKKFEEAYFSYFYGIQEMNKSYSPSTRYLVSLYVNMAHIHNIQNEPLSAIHYLNKAKEQNNKAKAFYHAGEITFQSALAYGKQNDIVEAKNNYKLAESFYSFSGETHYLGSIYTNSGIIERDLGSLSESYNYLQKAIDYFQKSPLQDRLHNCNYEMAVTLTKLERWQEALNLALPLSQAFSHVPSTESTLVLKVDLLLGEIYMQLDQMESAEKHLLLSHVLVKKYEEIDIKIKHAVLKRLIQYYEQMGEPNKKKIYLLELLETID